MKLVWNVCDDRGNNAYRYWADVTPKMRYSLRHPWKNDREWVLYRNMTASKYSSRNIKYLKGVAQRYADRFQPKET